jgi:hypothetical protein
MSEIMMVEEEKMIEPMLNLNKRISTSASFHHGEDILDLEGA